MRMKGGDVQNTSGLVRSLQMFAEFNEGIALLLGDGRLERRALAPLRPCAAVLSDVLAVT